ncbi:MAG: MotA/TolQ/ExbB proton channel family protein [Planctomycetaceae bacterium]
MTPWNHRIAIVSTVLLLALFGPILSGDESAENTTVPPAAEAAAEQTPADESILDLIMGTGLTGLAFVVALGLFSFIAVTVAIERLVNTRRAYIVPSSFVSELKKVVESDHSTPMDLKTLCDRHDATVATILLAGVQRAGRPLPEIEKAMEDAAAREMGALRSKVRPLAVAGSVSPLVGLLGTVVGMIIAFKTASQAGLGKGEMLAQGIYMALVTTAAGLLIAIPSMLCAAYFNGRLEKYFREIDEALMPAFRCFARVENRVASAPQAEGNNDTGSLRPIDKLMAMK